MHFDVSIILCTECRSLKSIKILNFCKTTWGIRQEPTKLWIMIFHIQRWSFFIQFNPVCLKKMMSKDITIDAIICLYCYHSNASYSLSCPLNSLNLEVWILLKYENDQLNMHPMKMEKNCPFHDHLMYRQEATEMSGLWLIDNLMILMMLSSESFLKNLWVMAWKR